MRIACISTSQVPSRTANSMQLMKVCQALSDLGHELVLWVPEVDAGADWDMLASHYGVRGGFEIRRLPRRRALRGYGFSWSAVRAARRWEAGLLYVWPYQAAALGSLLGHPTLLELHDRPSGAMGPLLLRLFLRGRGARRVLYTSYGLRNSLPGSIRERLQPTFARRGPNGVELERFADLPEPQTARRALGVPERFTAGYAGHLYPGRGLELMLELASRVSEANFLWIGGEPEAVERWRRRADQQGVSNLELRGFVPNAELPRWLAACEVLLMPYQRRIAVSSGGDTAASASPMKAFEYLAAGRAILSSDLPVLREVLDERCALLLPPDDTAAWERALRALIADPEERLTLAERARKEAEQYSWKRRARRALEGLVAE